MVPNLVSSPRVLWQLNIRLGNPNLPYSGEVIECSVLFRIIGRVPSNTGRVLLKSILT
jgi:hypothetical protein